MSSNVFCRFQTYPKTFNVLKTQKSTFKKNRPSNYWKQYLLHFCVWVDLNKSNLKKFFLYVNFKKKV